MIVLGIILILVGYLLPVPAFIATIGWILLVVLSSTGQRITGTRVTGGYPQKMGSARLSR